MKLRLLINLVLVPAIISVRLAAALSEAAPLFTRLSGPVVVPAEMTNRSLYVSVMINERGPFRMLVDTGSSVALVTTAVAAAVEAREVETDSGPANSINAFGE